MVIRPIGYGMSGLIPSVWIEAKAFYKVRVQLLENNTSRAKQPSIIPFSTGRVPFGTFPGTSCQATIRQSLRETKT